MSTRTVMVNLNSIDSVKIFCEINTMKFGGIVEARSGRWVIDGKSIMGMFSLDLSKDIEVCLEADTEAEIDTLFKLYSEANFLV